jgi:Xaa-Pro aminopeptidase
VASAVEHAGRRERLRTLWQQRAQADLLVVTDLSNIRYLTGFSGSNAVLVLGRDGVDDLLGTDGRYRDQVAQEAPGLATVIDRSTLAATLDASPRGRVAVEDSMSLGEADSVGARGGPPLVVSGLVQELRAVKDAGELALLQAACAITVAALAALATEVRVGVTEVSLARRLEQLFGELGAEDRAFDSIVGSGPNSAIPHHQPGGRVLEAGDLLVIDAGARVGGYHADMTRSFVVGAPPAGWQSEIHGAVESARAAAAAGYRPGAGARALHDMAREVIETAGFGEAFTHGLGHGVGLDIHEAPMVGPRATGTISADMAITVEPGIYLPGRGGVRIEDTLVVTDTGPRILTEAPRDLVVVG